MYIEQASYDLSRKHRVRVATSDGMEQMIILGHGAEPYFRNELHWEVEQANEHIEAILKNCKQKSVWTWSIVNLWYIGKRGICNAEDFNQRKICASSDDRPGAA